MNTDVTEQDLIQAVLLATVKEYGEGLTAPEIATMTQLGIVVVRHRLKTLKDAGLITPTKVLRQNLDNAWRRTAGYTLAKDNCK